MRTKTQERHDAILRAAEEIFQQEGFERASMAQICKQVGFSKATLYSYFASKEELFFEVMMNGASAEFEAGTALLTASADSPRATLEEYGQRFVSALYSPRVQAIRRLIAAEGNRSELGRKCYDRGPAQGEKLVAEYLQRLIANQHLCEGDTIVMARQLHSLMEAEWLEQFLFGTITDLSAVQIQQAVRLAVETFLRAYHP